MQILRTWRALPALAVALVALFVAVSGSALAASHASHHGPVASAAHHKKHKKHRHHKKRRKHRHASPAPMPNPAPTPMPSGSSGSPSTGSSSSSQTTPPQSFAARDAGTTPIGTGPDGTVVESLSLPANGKYVVSAKAELGNNAASDNTVSCQLLENFNPLDSSSEALAPQATFSRTITLSATSMGGNVKLSCTGTKGAQARNRVITAVRTS